MITPNFLAVLVAALSSFAVGFVWYNPKVMGTLWMKETGITPDKAQKANMIKIFGLTFVFAFMIAFMLQLLVIHQWGAYSAQADVAGVDPSIYENYFNAYQHSFRTFKHGVFHGLMFGLLLIVPIFATNALFEQKSWKYVLVNAGYWVINFMLMGGIISAWE